MSNTSNLEQLLLGFYDIELRISQRTMTMQEQNETLKLITTVFEENEQQRDRDPDREDTSFDFYSQRELVAAVRPVIADQRNSIEMQTRDEEQFESGIQKLNSEVSGRELYGMFASKHTKYIIWEKHASGDFERQQRLEAERMAKMTILIEGMVTAHAKELDEAHHPHAGWMEKMEISIRPYHEYRNEMRKAARARNPLTIERGIDTIYLGNVHGDVRRFYWYACEQERDRIKKHYGFDIYSYLDEIWGNSDTFVRITNWHYTLVYHHELSDTVFQDSKAGESWNELYENIAALTPRASPHPRTRIESENAKDLEEFLTSDSRMVELIDNMKESYEFAHRRIVETFRRTTEVQRLVLRTC